jgi:hypothetical protein
MSVKLQQVHSRQTDRANALFLLRNALNSLTISVNNLVNPVSRISEDARKHLSFGQQVALENSFSLRTIHLKRQLAQLRTQLAQPENQIFANIPRIRFELERLRNEYLKSEMVYGFYLDLLHTRGVMGMGKILRGYDRLALDTLRLFLSPLRYNIPKVVVYLEQIGDGAAIMRADIALWDRIRNPCAVIKVPQNSICTPRSSIFHEAGHQIGSITGLNREAANLLYNTVRAAGGSIRLAQYWRLCATEIVADQVATQLTNWIGALTLYNIYSGSSGSSLGRAARMFAIIPFDTHLMGYLRIRSNIASCRLALGRGPWDQLEKALEILNPPSLAPNYSRQTIMESLPILPNICRALSSTKFASFRGKSFEEICPMRWGSLNSIKKLLNFDLSNFSVGMKKILENPILTLVAFGTLGTIGGKSLYWITEQICRWLTALGDNKEVL